MTKMSKKKIIIFIYRNNGNPEMVYLNEVESKYFVLINKPEQSLKQNWQLYTLKKLERRRAAKPTAS